ncbi:MAG: PorP/SprF family type IX secretion system membrane protein [Saprospiraceae bacterium]
MLRFFTLITVLCLSIGHSFGQDIHFSQFNMSPLTMNPALSGAFSGTFRVGAIYRDQYGVSGLLSNQYTTPAIYVDAPVIKGFRAQDWVGAGVTMYQDQAGTLGLANGAFLISGAYHLALDKKQKSVLTLGFQMGGGQRSIKNKDKARFEDEIIDGMPSEDIEKVSDADAQYTDYAAGLLFTRTVNANLSFQAGFAVGHMFKPKVTVFNSSDRIGRRITLHGSSVIGLNERFRLTPAFQFQAFGKKSMELSLQSLVGYKIDPTKDIFVNAGLGYRVGESIQAHVGADIKSLRVGICYDFPTVAIKPTGSFELALSYIFKIYKKPKVKPVIFCPRF